MAHEETVRMVSGAKNAVLFMHGIAGTPEHFRLLMPLEHLVPGDWSVYNLLMDGHGREVRDFSKTSMERWKAQTMAVFDRLCDTHDRVVVVGHSMGTLFAVQMALRRPEKVPFIFLLDCPLRVGVKPFGAVNLIKLSYGLLDQKDPVQAATSQVSSIRQTWKSWQYIGWLPRVEELVREMHRIAVLVPELQVKAVAFQSKRDELVSCRSCRILRQSGKVEVHGLPRSTHFYYDPKDIATVQKRFCALLKQVDE